eukprot:scaffold12461_cov67-Phaeocystis_antarctica.AAC.6
MHPVQQLQRNPPFAVGDEGQKRLCRRHECERRLCRPLLSPAVSVVHEELAVHAHLAEELSCPFAHAGPASARVLQPHEQWDNAGQRQWHCHLAGVGDQRQHRAQQQPNRVRRRRVQKLRHPWDQRRSARVVARSWRYREFRERGGDTVVAGRAITPQLRLERRECARAKARRPTTKRLDQLPELRRQLGAQAWPTFRDLRELRMSSGGASRSRRHERAQSTGGKSAADRRCARESQPRSTWCSKLQTASNTGASAPAASEGAAASSVSPLPRASSSTGAGPASGALVRSAISSRGLVLPVLGTGGAGRRAWRSKRVRLGSRPAANIWCVASKGAHARRRWQNAKRRLSRSGARNAAHSPPWPCSAPCACASRPSSSGLRVAARPVPSASRAAQERPGKTVRAATARGSATREGGVCSTGLALQRVRVAASCRVVRRASGPSVDERVGPRQDPLAQVRQRVDSAALEQPRVQGCAKAQVAQSARGLDSHRVELGPQRGLLAHQPAGAPSWEVVGLPHAQAPQEQGYRLTVQILAPAASRDAARKVGERGGRLE